MTWLEDASAGGITVKVSATAYGNTDIFEGTLTGVDTTANKPDRVRFGGWLENVSSGPFDLYFDEVLVEQ